MSIRLAGLALDHWEALDGWATAHNMPELPQLPLDRFNNFVWWFLTKDAGDQQSVEKFRIRLWRPPPRTEITPDNPWSAENETRAFAGLKAALAPKNPG